MADNRKKINEQFVTRTIRKAIIAFDSAETDEQRMRAMMALSALGALNLIENTQMVVSTSRFIEAKLRI
jgi:hypothetical protein